MKLSVPFNGQDDLMLQLKRYPEVREVYGKLASDFIGGGKNSFQIPFISRCRFAYNVKQAHKYGLEFNYLLNSSCLDNAEWTMAGQNKIMRLIDWLVGLKIDAVTVATPYLLELVKKRFPALKIYVSDLAYINSIERAKYWENLGAKRITLFNVDVNRNFCLLKNIRKNVKCELKLILNVNCLSKCPYYLSHANLASHGSQSGHLLRGFVIDYCRISCRYQQIMNPVDFIRSTWIRPEDVSYYEEIGIDCFKIIDRGMTTQTIVDIIKAYAKRSYDGNLLDLFPDPSRSIMFLKKNLFSKIKYFLRPFTVNVFKLRKFAGLVTNAIYIDNRKLDGFLEKIKDLDCDKLSCEECGYCYGIAKKAVRINEGQSKIIKEMYKGCLETTVSGSLFKYY